MLEHLIEGICYITHPLVVALYKNPEKSYKNFENYSPTEICHVTRDAIDVNTRLCLWNNGTVLTKNVWVFQTPLGCLQERTEDVREQSR